MLPFCSALSRQRDGTSPLPPLAPPRFFLFVLSLAAQPPAPWRGWDDDLQAGEAAEAAEAATDMRGEEETGLPLDTFSQPQTLFSSSSVLSATCASSATLPSVRGASLHSPFLFYQSPSLTLALAVFPSALNQVQG